MSPRFDPAIYRRLRDEVHRSDMARNQTLCGNDGIWLAYGLVAGLFFVALLLWIAAQCAHSDLVTHGLHRENNHV